MSKASEWALAREEAKRRFERLEQDDVPVFRPRDECFYEMSPAAWADTDGLPYFDNVKGKWTRANAIALAKWLLDTFGEEMP